MHACFSALVIGLCWLGGTGCHSIYRETTATYPADPCARLKLRIDEAQAAEQRAEKAAATLPVPVAQEMIRPKIQADVDRLELTIREFGRRVAAVRDAEANCDQTALFAAEIQRLQQRSNQLAATAHIQNPGVSPSGP